MRFLKHARKRGLALFMALVMCLSLLPVTAMAADGEETDDPIGSGTETITQSDANAYLVPGIPQKGEDNIFTFEGENGLSYRYKDDSKKECIEEQSIFFNGEIAESDSIYIEVNGEKVSEFTVNEQTWSVTSFEPADQYAAKQTGIQLKLQGSLPADAVPDTWNQALVAYLKDHLKAKLTNPELDYQIVFGSASSGYAYNAANGHYYTYKKWENANWSGIGGEDKTENRTWANAKKLAHAETYKNMEGHLLTITSAQEQEFVQKLFKGQFWTAGTRDPSLLGNNKISQAVQDINEATWGKTIADRVLNGVTQVSDLMQDGVPTGKSFCGWFWGDGPESELGLIYYPFSVNKTNSSAWIQNLEFSGQHTSDISEELEGAFENQYSRSWHYKSSGGSALENVAFNNWTTGTGGAEPNDCHDAYSGSNLAHDEYHEVCMHVYEHGGWNDYRKDNTAVVGFLVEFEGATQDTNTAPVRNATVNINMSQNQEIVVLTDQQPTYKPEITTADGTPVPGVKVDGQDPTGISTPGRHKITATYTDGENSYFIDKAVTVIDLATKVTCETAPNTHNTDPQTTEHLKDGTYNATWNAQQNAFVVTITNPGSYVNEYRPGGKNHTATTADDNTIQVKVTINGDNTMAATKMDGTPLVKGTETATDGTKGKYIVPIPTTCTAELTKVEKKLVTSPNALDGVLTAGVLFLGDENTYGNIKVEGGTIKLGENDEVKLLYAITVTGTEGAAYKVTDENATFVPQTGVTLSEDKATGILGATGTVTLYAYRTFGRNNIQEATDKSNLVNSVTLEPGNTDTKVKPDIPDDPDDPNPPKPDDPNNPTKITDDESTPAKKLYNVTVKYVDESGKPLKFIDQGDGSYASEQTVTGIENNTPYRTDEVKGLIYSGLVDETGNHYVMERETITGNEGDTVKDQDVVITVTYTLDNWDEYNPEKPDPKPDDPNKPGPDPDPNDPNPNPPGDDIPDKYQVKVIYTTDGNGQVNPYADTYVDSYAEIYSLYDRVNDRYLTSGDVGILGTTAKATTESYDFFTWDVAAENKAAKDHSATCPACDKNGSEIWSIYLAIASMKEELHPTTAFPVQGGHVYTFTASFAPAQPAASYTLTYKTAPEGGDITKDEVPAGSSTEIQPEYKQDGKTFIGWTTDPEGKTQYTPGGPITPTGDMTFYPVWEYTLTYDSNGGSGEMTSDSATSTASYVELNVQNNGFTAPEGMKFIGWKDETGKEYKPGEPIFLTANLTLYAQWTPVVAVPETFGVQYFIHYHLQDDEGGYHYVDRYDEVRTVTLHSREETVPVAVRYTDIKEIPGYSYSFEETVQRGWMDGIVKLPTSLTDIVTLSLYYTKDAEPQDSDLTVTKASNQTSLDENGQAEWTVTVKNNSSRVYANLSISDTLTVTKKDATQETVTLTPDFGRYTDATVTIDTVQQRYNGWMPFGTMRMDEPEIEDPAGDAFETSTSDTALDVDASGETGAGAFSALPDALEETESISAEQTFFDGPEDDLTEPDPVFWEQLRQEIVGSEVNPSYFDLYPGEEVTFTVSYQVQAGDRILKNHVDVKDDTGVDHPGDAPDIPVTHDSDLSVEKTRITPERVNVGDTIRWNIVITNNTGAQVNVSVEDTLSNAAGSATLTLADGTAVGSTVTVPAGDLTILASYQAVLADAGRKLVNTVVVTDNNDPGNTGTGTSEETYVNPQFTVTYRDGVGGTAFADEVHPNLSYGTATPAFNGTPTRAGYTFTGWTPAVAGTVTGNVVYVATWSEIPVTPTYTVTYLDGVGGAAFANQTYSSLSYGTATPAFAGTPVRTGYAFLGWTPAVAGTVTDNAIYTAQWQETYVPTEPTYPTYPTYPTAPVTPVTPPTTTIPDVNPPLADNPDSGTTINDQDVPLAGTVGLNDVDHFAYVIGYPDDTVHPLANITRAEAATIFFRLMTEEYRSANWSTSNDFSDVKAGDWYNNAVSTCARASVVKGYEDGTFRPNAPITRAEFAAMAAGFMDASITDEGVGDFSDTADHWAASAIRRAAKAGWVTGDGNRFRPNDNITRAEVMTIVNRMLDRTPDKDHMLPDMKKWSDNPEDAWYYEAVQEATNEHDYERDETAVETWTLIKEHRDWAALELGWAANNGASAPAAGTETEPVTEPETQSLPDGI